MPRCSVRDLPPTCLLSAIAFAAYVLSGSNLHAQNPGFARDKDDNVRVADFKLHVVRKHTPVGEQLMTLETRGESGEDETHSFAQPVWSSLRPATFS